ncbi:hypothetical protein VK70_19545 [Paenibacillus durus ATCC 35681]|uniref:Uncharacterized protein n=1 Tax=Paenibacillus durus ATCC 35681 TaxID=1333534 RepID=A0A0F7CJT4_PAEDU|nr:hypothetical protein VK70_19545 [Paenibacillus durus ATCC 35681]
MFGGDLPVKRQSRKQKRKSNRATVQTTSLWAQLKKNLFMGVHLIRNGTNLLVAEEKTVHFLK